MSLLSLDIGSLYFSLDTKIMIEKVESAVMEQIIINFHNHVGLSLKVFIQLLRPHLSSLPVDFEKNSYNKKQVCIGSSVSPALSKIYLSAEDVQVQFVFARWTNCGNLYVLRLVDEYMVMHTEEIKTQAI